MIAKHPTPVLNHYMKPLPFTSGGWSLRIKWVMSGQKLYVKRLTSQFKIWCPWHKSITFLTMRFGFGWIEFENRWFERPEIQGLVQTLISKPVSIVRKISSFRASLAQTKHFQTKESACLAVTFKKEWYCKYFLLKT